MSDLDEMAKALARKVSGRPGWTDAPAVQAWHRSDGRTEHDGTPGKPRIWSPDYRTTETWSTPSLRHVHWSELVDVAPLAAAEQETRADHLTPERARSLVQERDELADALDTTLGRAMKAERELVEARHRVELLGNLHLECHEQRDRAWASLDEVNATVKSLRAEDIERIVTENRYRVADAIRSLHPEEPMATDVLAHAVMTALTEPLARPEGAEDLEALLREAWDRTVPFESPTESAWGLADWLAERGVRAGGDS